MGRALTERTRQRARALFLDELRQRGNVKDAAAAAGIARRTAYQWRDADEEFAAAWVEAIEEAADAMEREAWRRAVDGFDEPVFGRIGRDQDGEVGTIRRYSDSLMQLLLKAHRPEKYRERQQVEHTGGIAIEYVNDWRQQEG